MDFDYTCMEHWPPLAWLAQCSRAKSTIRVLHGSSIEAKERWFCEAVWDGNFSDGDFDKTDVVAGSGARIRRDIVCFVSSGSDVDRLHSLRVGDIEFISNSLICLLAWIGDTADPSYHGYTADFAEYRYTVFGKRSLLFPTLDNHIKLTYFANLVWDGSQFNEIDKPRADRRFNCFKEYRNFMQDALHRIADNAGDVLRTRRYKLLCPLSNGYDSPTVAALARGVDGVKAFTFDVDRERESDSGQTIAAILGIPCHVIDRDAWRSVPLAEVPFIAASGSIGDLVFQPAENLLGGTVLITGYGGDFIWNKRAPHAPLAIGGGSMLGLTEYRLWTGFLNCPVAVWGVRQLPDVVRISNSSEMKSWDIGGNYSRPICRRIVEEAGVPRAEFGMGKRGVSVVPSARGEFLSAASMEDLLAWLGEQRTHSKNPAISFPRPVLARTLDQILTPLAKSNAYLLRKIRQYQIKGLSRPLNLVGEALIRPYYHHPYLVHWAIDRAKLRYQRVNEKVQQVGGSHSVSLAEECVDGRGEGRAAAPIDAIQENQLYGCRSLPL